MENDDPELVKIVKPMITLGNSNVHNLPLPHLQFRESQVSILLEIYSSSLCCMETDS